MVPRSGLYPQSGSGILGWRMYDVEAILARLGAN
jgi:hypothetical protein